MAERYQMQRGRVTCADDAGTFLGVMHSIVEHQVEGCALAKRSKALSGGAAAAFGKTRKDVT